MTVDEWAAGLAAYSRGARMLTPARYVRAHDWATLLAVVAAGAATARDDVITLVPTDGEMLEPRNLEPFLSVIRAHAGDRQVAFAFAGSDRHGPLAARCRAAGLRELLDDRPGSLLLGVDALAPQGSPTAPPTTPTSTAQPISPGCATVSCSPAG
jgi:hypothetical protein